MTIEERLLRRAPEDIVFMGQMVEACLNSQMGAILKALTNGRATSEAVRSASGINGRLPADRVLGRIEAYANLMMDLEQFVADKDALLKPLEEEKVEEQKGVEAPGS